MKIFSDPTISALQKEKVARRGSQMSDDEPLYDSVASDDDYAALTTDPSSIIKNQVNLSEAKIENRVVLLIN